ncbi:MAG: acyl-CoA dehydrogenase family protein, partial [Pseudomonadales bacterium]
MDDRDQALVDFAADWQQQLPQRSAEIEEARRLPADISAAFAAGGIYHALVPAEYGGLEAHPATAVEVIRRMAEGDGSVGWNVMIGMTTGLLAASLPEAFARQIYGEAPGVMTVGVTAPLGKADKVEGGHLVSGRWPFGSGSENAQWICGGCHLFEQGEQVKDKSGAAVNHLMLFERDQVTIEDTWHVSGLSGTGSHHFHVEGAFVPEGRSVVLGRRALVKRPLYQFPMLGLLALGVSSVSLGIGRKAVRTFMELAGAKTPTGASRSLAARPQVQSDLAQSLADLESAETYMADKIHAAFEVAQQGERLSLAVKAGLRLAAINATHRAVAAVDRLYRAGGGSSIYRDNDLQRCFRDIHVTTQHIMVGMPVYEVIGR